MDEFEQAKNSLALLSETTELVSSFSDVSKVLNLMSSFAHVFPFVGAVLGLIQGFLPDSKHDEILRGFEKLSDKIDLVREDIRELENTIKWEGVKLQYGDAVDRIKLGMHYCLEIGKAKDQNRKIRYQKRLKDVCANEEFTLALRALLDGMTGTGLFRSSILDELYVKTKGHRPKISSLAGRLLQLVSGGMMVSATYEAAVHGKEGAKDMMELYKKRLSEVKIKVQSVVDRCMNNFQENMLIDLNNILDKGGENEPLFHELNALMDDKYDWQEHYCLVYNDLWGFDKHCFSGYLVSSLHRNGKCGIVFYRTKGEPARFSHRYNEAYQIVNDANGYNAQAGYYNIVNKLAERGIRWTGCAVTRRYINLWFGGSFSTWTVSIVGADASKILMLE